MEQGQLTPLMDTQMFSTKLRQRCAESLSCSINDLMIARMSADRRTAGERGAEADKAARQAPIQLSPAWAHLKFSLGVRQRGSRDASVETDT